jgi:formate/nitrite transporter FocA (FNT family)
MFQTRRRKRGSALLAGLAVGASLVAIVFAFNADGASANDALIFIGAIFGPLGIAMCVWPR